MRDREDQIGPDDLSNNARLAGMTNPNQPKAPTHLAMNELVRNAALYVLDDDRLAEALRYIASAEANEARIAELEREVATLRERANNPCRCEFGEYGWIKSECPVHG